MHWTVLKLELLQAEALELSSPCPGTQESSVDSPDLWRGSEPFFCHPYNITCEWDANRAWRHVERKGFLEQSSRTTLSQGPRTWCSPIQTARWSSLWTCPTTKPPTVFTYFFHSQRNLVGNTACRPWPIRTTGSWSELRSSPNQQCKHSQWLQHRYKFCIERNHSLKFWNIFLNMICDRAADVPHTTVSSMVWRLSGFCLAAQTSTHMKYPDSCPSPWLTRHRSFITKQ